MKMDMNLFMILESNIFAIVTALISIVVSFTVIKIKVENLEKRLNKLDELKIEATLAEIKVEIKYIRALLEANIK